MKIRHWMTALAAGAFCVLIGAGGTLAQTTAPAAAAPAPAAPALKKAKAKPQDQSQSSVDVTVVNSRAADLVELQATAEKAAFDDSHLGALLTLARKGVAELIEVQRKFE